MTRYTVASLMNDHQPVYFIGIALPDTISSQIFALKWQLHDEITHTLKPLVPHVTLLHPQSLRSTHPSELLPKIRKISSGYLPLSLTLTEIQDFEKKVLYVGVHSPALTKLQAELVQLLPAESQALYRERGFIPHVTLMQVRGPHTLDTRTLSRKITSNLTLPSQLSVNSISFFTQVAKREYRSAAI